MKRSAQVFLGALAVIAALSTRSAYAAATLHLTTEVLVLHSAATQIPRDTLSKGFEIYNNGPNKIWCALVNSADAVSGKSRPISPGGFWSADIGGRSSVWCLADTADQVTGGATVISEARP